MFEKVQMYYFQDLEITQKLRLGFCFYWGNGWGQEFQGSLFIGEFKPKCENLKHRKRKGKWPKWPGVKVHPDSLKQRSFIVGSWCEDLVD